MRLRNLQDSQARGKFRYPRGLRGASVSPRETAVATTIPSIIL
jgi:hypothetical protein